MNFPTRQSVRRPAVWLLASAWLLGSALGCGTKNGPVLICPEPPPIGPSVNVPSISLVGAAGSDEARFEVLGFSPAVLADLAEREPGDRALFDGLAVYFGDMAKPDALPMLGEHRVEGEKLVFYPRYPLQAGASYTVISLVPAADAWTTGANISEVFTLPAAEPSAPASILAVYPTSDVLPENQLKFYLHFSAPMSRGEAYQRVRLLKASGEEVEFPFLELGEELWDESGARFTLFFDPGRIKRGLKPREEVGPSLIEGESYILVIDGAWPDAAGRPLVAGFRKEFKAVAPDDVQPAPARWKTTPPKAGGALPLVVEFDEPLDHAMLGRVIAVENKEGMPVSGSIKIERQETRWEFTPREEWRAGKYNLVMDAALEDLAGNSLAKPFEVDIFNQVESKPAVEIVRVPFEVAE